MITPSAFNVSFLLGPFGGIVALAYAAGCASGWAFSSRTVLKIVIKEREECERRIAALENRVRELEERYFGGMERQLMQVRDSSVRIIDRGRVRDADDIP